MQLQGLVAMKHQGVFECDKMVFGIVLRLIIGFVAAREQGSGHTETAQKAEFDCILTEELRFCHKEILFCCNYGGKFTKRMKRKIENDSLSHQVRIFAISNSEFLRDFLCNDRINNEETVQKIPKKSVSLSRSYYRHVT